MAECYSVILEQGKNTSSPTSKVAFVAPWSFYESGGNSSLYDLSIINTVSTTCSPTANVERSTYWYMQMMGQYFKGTYYKGSNNVGTAAVKQFGSYLANGGYALMILNEETSTSYSTCVINTGTVLPTTGVLNIKMNMPVNASYTITSPGVASQETQLIILDCNGNLVKHFKYASGSSTITTYSTGTGIAPLSLSVTSTSTDCNSNTGSATVTPTGGTGTYTYSWSNGSTSATASSLAAGTHTVTVSSQTCTAGVSALVTIGKKSPTLTLSSVNGNSCSTGVGNFTVTPSGGTSPYTYTWTPGGANTSTISIANPGINAATTYSVVVKDAAGCANAAVVAHYGTHTVSITPTPTAVGTCCAITLTATYIPGAQYTWKKGTTVLSGNTYSVALGNGFGGPGTYSVSVSPTYSVTDACGTVSYSISVPSSAFSCNCGQGPAPRLADSPIEPTTAVNCSINSVIPNPASHGTTVNYSLAKDIETADLVIYDLFGHALRKYQLTSQSHTIEIDCRELDAGMYFSALMIGGKWLDSKKIMILK